MAAAAIEALFWGNDTFDFEPDPGAVVLWFSDSIRSLNMQTFNRLLQASEKFTYSNLKLIKPPFSTALLEPGRVYFLNMQRLGAKSSLLTRSHPEAAPDEPQAPCRRCSGRAGHAGLDDLGDAREHDRGWRPHAVPRAG